MANSPNTEGSIASTVATGSGHNLLRGAQVLPRRLSLEEMEDFYEPIDDGNGAPPFRSRPRSSCRQRFSTRGSTFNFIVGVVIAVNSVLIGLEADLGLLGTGDPQWSGFDTDAKIIGAGRAAEAEAKAGLQKGLELDAELKVDLQKEVSSKLDKDVDFRDELTLHAGTPHLRYGAYTVAEFCFVAFYALELLVRLCDSGRCSFFMHDRWNHFDALVMFLGVIDLSLPFVFSDPEVSASAVALMSVFRMSRVLRVVRLFRVCGELRAIGWGILTAFSTVLWIGVVVVILNFVLASLLTSLLGQKSYLWGSDSEQIEAWFGSIGRSMQTLFGIMTLSGFTPIATKVSEVVPGTVVALAIVLYIMLCFFTVLSLVTSIINLTFASAMKDQDKIRLRVVEDHKQYFGQALTNVFMASDQSQRGFLTRAEFRTTLEAHPAVLSQMRRLEMETSLEELLQLFDRLVQDSGCPGGVKIGSLVEAMTHYNQAASAADLFDTKYLLSAARRESTAQLVGLRQEVSANHREAMARTLGQVSDLRKELATVLQGMNAMQQHVAGMGKDIEGLKVKLDSLDRQQESDRQVLATERATVHQRFDQLARKFSGMNHISDKLQAVCEQVEMQRTVSTKIERLAEQFAASQKRPQPPEAAVGAAEGAADAEGAGEEGKAGEANGGGGGGAKAGGGEEDEDTVSPPTEDEATVAASAAAAPSPSDEGVDAEGPAVDTRQQDPEQQVEQPEGAVADESLEETQGEGEGEEEGEPKQRPHSHLDPADAWAAELDAAAAASPSSGSASPNHSR